MNYPITLEDAMNLERTGSLVEKNINGKKYANNRVCISYNFYNYLWNSLIIYRNIS